MISIGVMFAAMSVEFARHLRKTMTPAEGRLWKHLRPLKSGGFHFRRQAPFSGYVLDFVCYSARLVIEVDGDTHGTEVALRKDAARTALLEREGFRVVRFTNADVLSNIEGVMQVIVNDLGMDA